MNIILSILLTQTITVPSLERKECCVDHYDKPQYPLEKANYKCSQLSPFGKQRCKSVYGGNVCTWSAGSLCYSPKCQRKVHYEMHYGETIDVGLCSGGCFNKTLCTPEDVGIALINEIPVNVIKSCVCDSCAAYPRSYNVEINVDRCAGNCNGEDLNRVCKAGEDDNFNTGNTELSSPSPALISGILSGCSAGMQTGFDQFMNDRCFGHTFTDCLSKTSCPLRSAVLETCLQAANVALTQTDGIILGVNGVGLWSESLPTLNGGGWNPGDMMCFQLDLSNLAGGVNILNDIQTTGHLDVVVQDDTAVDFVTLTVEYTDCRVCVPKQTTVSHLYTSGGVQDFYRAETCDCVELGECRRQLHMVTYFEGTMFENSMDVGQCVGKCSGLRKCRGEYGKKEIQAPEGSRVVRVLKGCDCNKLTWNPQGKW